MKTPRNVKKDTEINNGERELTVKQYIIQKFKTTTNKENRLHTEYISSNMSTVEAGRLFIRIGLGKYKNTNINGSKKAGYEGVKYMGDDEV